MTKWHILPSYFLKLLNLNPALSSVVTVGMKTGIGNAKLSLFISAAQFFSQARPFFPFICRFEKACAGPPRLPCSPSQCAHPAFHLQPGLSSQRAAALDAAGIHCAAECLLLQPSAIPFSRCNLRCLRKMAGNKRIGKKIGNQMPSQQSWKSCLNSRHEA